MASSSKSAKTTEPSRGGAAESAPAPVKEVQGARTTSKIIVRRVQKDNPLMMFIKDQPTEIGDIVADFEVGKTTGVLFLSLKYHRLHPEYIFGRIQALEKRYHLRVLLILCDVGDQHEAPIRELTKVCMINELTVIVSWSYEEAALYLRTYKVYETRPPDSIKERTDQDYNSVLRATLTTIRGVNKTDVTTLRTHFGSFSDIVHASAAELANCPGIGPTKVRRLIDAFNQPFRPGATSEKGKETIRQTAPLPEQPDPRPPPTPRREVTSELIDSTAAQRLGARKPRSPSPDWNIELDLNEDDETAGGSGPRVPQPPPWEREDQGGSNPPSTKQVGSRHSPDWNLNSSDEEVEL